ncbi:MAG: single-stranded DNA-binding protein [Myxococcales bacterium]|nr:single-stranded DNA-binding protein [Myxococcales bacterium]
MSNSINRVILVGHVGQDPTLKFADGDNACLKFSLATSDHYRDKNEALQERTEWHNVELWGPRAKPLSQLLVKGTQVMVEGSIRSRTVEGDGGLKRKFTDIRAREVLLLGKRSEATAAPASRPGLATRRMPREAEASAAGL